MKCHYRTDDGEWIKGYMHTLAATSIHFHPAEGTPVGRTYILHSHPEVLFHDNGMRVTGYLVVDSPSNLYKLVSVDASPGWVKPK